jgi:hypothetical protein
MGIKSDSTNPVSLFICGDVLNKERIDGQVCSSELANIVTSADYAVCNFEAPVAGFGNSQTTPGVHHNQKSNTIAGLKQQGFDLILLANNHMLDFGEKALQATLNLAEENGLDTIGAGLEEKSAYQPLIKTIQGLKIGMVNGCEAQFGVIDYMGNPNKAGYAWINHNSIDMNIIHLRSECDFVIVFSHAGLENFTIPQKIWRIRYKHFCDLGADFVIGSHPHVPQGYEKYGNSMIFYSLGNFYFDSKEYIHKEDNSFAIWLELKKGNEPIFKPIFHYKKKGLVNLAPIDKQIDLGKLNALLGDLYSSEHDKMSLEVYNRIKNWLTISLFPPIPIDGKLKTFLHMLFSWIIKKKVKYRDLSQLLLLKNDSLSYAIKNALELKVQNRK